MDDVFVGRLMSDTVYTVKPTALVEDAAALMLDNGIGSVVVVDDSDRLEGILTSTDFVRIVAERQPKDRTPVAEYMTTAVETAGAQTLVADVADRMLGLGFHHMPVVDDDDVVIGMISTTDLAGYLSNGAAL